MASTNSMPSPLFEGYNSNPSRGLSIVIACLILPVLFVILRFLGRRVEHVPWWWDDWTTLLSLLLFIGGFWADVQIVQWPSAAAEAAGSFLVRVYVNNVLHTLVSATTKLSGLLLYLVHFGLERGYARMAYALIALVAAWGLAVFLATVFQCHPVSAAWDPSSFSYCVNVPALLEATSVSDAVISLLIIIGTFPGAYSIDWIFGRGTLIGSTYLLGLFDFCTSLLCAYYSTAYSPTTDPVATFTPYFLWTKLREAFGIVCVCLWPSAFGLLGVFTCSFQEPKSRVFGHYREKVRNNIRDEGYGALLGDSKERAEMAEAARGGKRGMEIGLEGRKRVGVSYQEGALADAAVGDSKKKQATTVAGTQAVRKGNEANARLIQLRAQLDAEAKSGKTQAREQVKEAPPDEAALSV